MYRTAGDPGFLGNLFRGVTRTIGGAIGGLIAGKGNPIGGIIGGVRGAVSATRSNIGASTLSYGDDPKGDAARLARVHAHHAAALAHHAAMPIGSTSAGTPVGGMHFAGQLPSGAFAGERGRRRRMNPYNPRALGRANRRMSSFLHHVRKFVHFYKHQEGTPKFKKPKGRK